MLRITRHRFSIFVASVGLLVSSTPARAADGVLAQPAVSGSSQASAVARFALILGNNESVTQKNASLRFADDDAARMDEFFRELGAETRLVSRLDSDTQMAFPSAAKSSIAPTKANLLRAFSELQAEMTAARARGSQTELVIYYSGHGEVGEDGQAFLAVGREKLTREEFVGKLLKVSNADYNHVILDACHSESIVYGKGKVWKDDRTNLVERSQVQQLIDRSSVEDLPSTGFLLATSSDQVTHEWDHYRGGVFTHEVLSGLRGAADINGDRTIEYSEIGAFIAAANQGVKVARARLDVMVVPPKQQQRIGLVAHPATSRERVLYFDSTELGHFAVEDARGVVLVEVNRTAEQPAYVRLPGAGDLHIYRVSATDGSRDEATVGSTDKGILRLAQLSFRPEARQERGAVDDALREGLFSTPYGTSYYEGYAAGTQVVPVEDVNWKVNVWQEKRGEDTIVHMEVTPKNQLPGGDPNAQTLDVAVTVAGDEPERESGISDPAPTRRNETVGTGPVPVTWKEGHDRGRRWGFISAGLELSPVASSGTQPGDASRYTANDLHGTFGAGGGSSVPVRGLDIRVGTFSSSSAWRFPDSDGYFRTGFAAGRVDFEPHLGNGAYAVGQTKYLDVLTVPLAFGGNVYAFDELPVRPYFGGGVGLDIVRLRYVKEQASTVSVVRGAVNAEIHAGLEARISNYVRLSGEMRQAWSTKAPGARGMPGYNHTGFTLIFGVQSSFSIERP